MLEKRTVHILTVAATILLTKLTTDLYVPALVDIQEIFNTDPFHAKLTLNIYMLGFACSVIICGPLAKKIGIKNTTLIALTACFITTTSCIFVQSIDHLIIIRFFEAIGAGVGTILGRIVINNKYSYNDRIKIFSYFAAMAAASTPTVPIIGGMINESLGWRYIFVTIAIINLIVLYLVFQNFEPDKERSKNVLPETLKNYYDLIRNPHFIYIIIINTTAWCSYFIYLNTSPFIFQKGFNLSSVEYAILFGISTLGFVIGSLSIRYFLKKIDLNKFLLRISIFNFIFICLSGLFHLYFPKTISSIIISFSLILFTVGATLPSCQNLVLNRFKYCSIDALSLHFFIQILSCGLFAIAAGLLTISIDMKLLILECVFAILLLTFSYKNSKITDV